uniref:Uncharacterized protein n=1 Tax=Tetradesmus obliquus TaxID=3088 RepID=A0A383VM17_TETOB|eukprot:jgi/Sobl393_1/12780/SZX66221.1
MADAAARCPGPAVVWDGNYSIDSSGRQQSPDDQLAAVARQYLQHLEQQDENAPGSVEKLIRQLVRHGWLAWGGKLAGRARATSRVAGDYSGHQQLDELSGAEGPPLAAAAEQTASRASPPAAAAAHSRTE